MYVKPKKHLGQHFLKNASIAEQIAHSLTGHGHYATLIEIGPGTGALTQHLLKLPYTTWVSEIDIESIAYLHQHYPELRPRILGEDFLAMNLQNKFEEKIAVIGNFPYNISSQILFHVLDHKNQVTELVGMFQKEVAMRVSNPPGGKEYGILSVLIQAWYDVEYLFTVNEEEFIPPPKVKSGVIRMKRNTIDDLGCDEVMFKRVVKTAFNQRRKTLRNSLKSLLPQGFENEMLQLRPERLTVAQFIQLTKWCSPDHSSESVS
jgi:16S rRNA (adenine1518-N6/adenine1519-N6)-dimethyltransferase